MTLSSEQIERNAIFLSILDICNQIYTGINMFKEHLKKQKKIDGETYIKLSNDAKFLEKNILGTITLLDRLLICHEEFEIDNNKRRLEEKLITIISALKVCQGNFDVITNSSCEQIQDNLKQILLPRLCKWMSEFIKYIQSHYFDESYIKESDGYLTFINMFNTKVVPPMEVELEEISTKEKLIP